MHVEKLQMRIVYRVVLMQRLEELNKGKEFDAGKEE